MKEFDKGYLLGLISFRASSQGTGIYINITTDDEVELKALLTLLRNAHKNMGRNHDMESLICKAISDVGLRLSDRVMTRLQKEYGMVDHPIKQELADNILAKSDLLNPEPQNAVYEKGDRKARKESSE